MADRKRFYVITDDAPWACLAVFGIALYGLPDWAEIVESAKGIEAIPDGSTYRGCWHFAGHETEYMRRLVVERRAARELIAADEGFMSWIEAKIAERDRLPNGPADDAITGARADVVIVDEHHHQREQEAVSVSEQGTGRKANKWH